MIMIHDACPGRHQVLLWVARFVSQARLLRYGLRYDTTCRKAPVRGIRVPVQDVGGLV